MYKLNRDNLPGLYQSASQASGKAQNSYFLGLKSYLVLLVVAALVSFFWSNDSSAAIVSAALFLITLAILIILKVKRPDDLWYQARSVTESVKTMAWRWSMRAKPYEDTAEEDVSQKFIDDLKGILYQNRSWAGNLDQPQDPISETMRQIRDLAFSERLNIYQEQRIKDQIQWYTNKSQFNKSQANIWFVVSVILHAVAIAMLLYKIANPNNDLPIAVVSTAAGAVLTWLQAKRFNDLNSSYALAAQEIKLIEGEAHSINSEEDLSKFVVNSETAFSREHTQWVAKKI